MNTIQKTIVGVLSGAAIAGGAYQASPNDVALDSVKAKYEASQTIKSVYQMQDSRFVIDNGDKNKVKTEIGEAGKTEFEPALKITKWEGEVSFKVKPDISKIGKFDKKLKLEGDNIRYQADKVDYVFYDKPDASENGGYEFEIVLNSKPASNVFQEKIESAGVVFYKQPEEMTPQEIAMHMYRPEEARNSIAIYGTKKGDFTALGGMNYTTGKLAHIYRIKAVDSNGNWTWCDQDIANGVWTKTCPQEWLNTAVYPVLIDPTFGYTDVGSGDFEIGASNYIIGEIGAPASSGTMTKITARFGTWTTGKKVKGAIYRGGSSGSTLMTPQTAEITSGTANAANDFNFTGGPSVTGSSTYTINVWANAATINIKYEYTGSGSDPICFTGLTYGAWPATLASDKYTTGYNVSIYGTYTAAEETQGVLIE